MPPWRLRTPAPGTCWQNLAGLLHHRPPSPEPQCHPDGHRLHLRDGCSGPGASPSPTVSQWPSGLSDALGAPGTQEGRLTSGMRGGRLSLEPARRTLAGSRARARLSSWGVSLAQVCGRSQRGRHDGAKEGRTDGESGLWRAARRGLSFPGTPRVAPARPSHGSRGSSPEHRTVRHPVTRPHGVSIPHLGGSRCPWLRSGPGVWAMLGCCSILTAFVLLKAGAGQTTPAWGEVSGSVWVGCVREAASRLLRWGAHLFLLVPWSRPQTL